MSPSAGKKPDLDRCVETLESISRDAPTKASPKTIAELYLAAVGLLCHLKADQVTLRERRYVFVGAVFEETLNRKFMFGIRKLSPFPKTESKPNLLVTFWENLLSKNGAALILHPTNLVLFVFFHPLSGRNTKDKIQQYHVHLRKKLLP